MDDFIKTFNALALHKHRYNVFQDFVTLSAISLYNAIYKDDTREQEYFKIIKGYSKEELSTFCELLGRLVIMLEKEPRDVLGELYMSLDLGNAHAGQFFTPPHLSELLARMSGCNELEDRAFITFSDPCCGAGSFPLAFVKLLISEGYNPMYKVWMQCIDIDRTVALMCFVQLTLWNVPAIVLVGDSLELCWSSQKR